MQSDTPSRIFVKNLPPALSQEDFRKHFSQLCPPTDIKILPHRRIGYVGYKTPEDATRAVKYYNKTFVGLARLKVEIAEPIGSTQRKRRRLNDPIDGDELSRETNHHVEDGNTTQASQKQSPGTATKSAPGPRSNDRSSSKQTWRNEDETRPLLTNGSTEGTQQNKPEVTALMNKMDLPKQENLIEDAAQPSHPDLPSPPKTPVSANASNLVGSQVDSADVEIVADKKTNASDREWLRSRTSRLLGLIDEDAAIEERFTKADRATEILSQQQEAAAVSAGRSKPDADHVDVPLDANEPSSEITSGNLDLAISNRLFVRNITYTATEEDLRMFFEDWSQTKLTEVNLPLDARSGNNKGFAHLSFADAEIARQIIRDADQQTFQGRLLHIMPSKGKKDSSLDDYNLSALPLKKQQAIKRKREAGQTTFNWNSLFMSADAVLSSIAQRFSVPKSDLLDPFSSDAAIKQAQAETHIIQETKAYFSSQGVDLEAFKGKERGDVALLVKNFPYETREDDLRSLFDKFGGIARILMPPAGTMAIVQFNQPEDAKAAFSGLAYRRFKDTILYLEKAPKGLLLDSKPATAATAKTIKTASTDLLESQPSDMGETVTVFVKNLNFSTTSQALHEAFAALSGFRSARVKTRVEAKRPGEVLSMGFGFLEFESQEKANSAITVINGYRLDGHELIARPSHRGEDAAQQQRKADALKRLRSGSTKVIIKNLPFEASKKDIRSLFGTYGKIRSVRLPKKYDHSTRGFAFAEFVSAREAENAIEALKNTHLLGRRLVLDFAAADNVDPEAEIEKMQERASKQSDKVALQKLVAGSARSKFAVEGVDDLDQGG